MRAYARVALAGCLMTISYAAVKCSGELLVGPSDEILQAARIISRLAAERARWMREVGQASGLTQKEREDHIRKLRLAEGLDELTQELRLLCARVAHMDATGGWECAEAEREEVTVEVEKVTHDLQQAIAVLKNGSPMRECRRDRDVGQDKKSCMGRCRCTVM